VPGGNYAPLEAIAGGELVHSQANEAALDHIPAALETCNPRSTADAAGLLWSAMLVKDTVIF